MGANNGSYNGTAPWQGLTTDVSEISDVKEAMKKAGLAWGVKMAPLVVQLPEVADLMVASGRKVTYRDDNNEVLGIVRGTYSPVSNYEWENVAEGILSAVESGNKFKEMGFTGVGEKVFGVADIPGKLVIGGADEITKKLLVSTAHDGTRSITMSFLPLGFNYRVFNLSNNKLRDKVAIRHTKTWAERTQVGVQALGVINHYYEQVGLVLNRLVDIQIDGDKFQNILDAVIPVPNEGRAGKSEAAREKVKEIFETSPTTTSDPKLRTTGWGLLNAYVEYADHYKIFAGRASKSKLESRFNSITEGSSFNLKKEVLAEILKRASE
jgi:phage/plasmid-like protein (TIGR03299 family)